MSIKRSGVSPATAERALLEEIEAVAAKGVTAEEIEKARNTLLAEHYRSLKTIGGKANLIGNYEVFHGDWSKLNNITAEYEKVTTEDVQRVAAKYLKGTNRTVATLIPETPAAKGGRQ